MFCFLIPKKLFLEKIVFHYKLFLWTCPVLFYEETRNVSGFAVFTLNKVLC